MEPKTEQKDQQDQQNQQQQNDDQQNQTTEDVQNQEIAALYEDEPAEPHMSVDQAIDGETSDQEGQEPAPTAKEKPAEGDQPKDEPAAGQDQAAAQDTKPKDESQQEPAQPKYAEPDGVFKIVGPDGAKLVSVKDMATTYQQYANLQQTHLRLKPTLDFVRQTNMPPDLVQPILAYGFAAYQRDMQSGNMIQSFGGPMPAPAAPGMPGMPGTPGAPGMPGAQPQPAAYKGPFKDEAQEAYFKERDPDMYAIIDNQRTQYQGVVNQLNQVLQAFSQLRSNVPAAQQPGQQSTESERVTLEQRQQFEKLINDWSGQYSDYFKPDEQGKNPNLDHFLAHLGRTYSNWKLEELTPERLTVAFSGFDPDYFAQQIQAQAKAKEEQLREQDRRAFGESNNVRTPAVPLQGQDKEIADLCDWLESPQ